MNGFKVVTQRVAICVGVISFAIVLLPSTNAKPTEDDRIEAYLKLRQDVLDTLRSSFQNSHSVIAERFDPKNAIAWPDISKERERQSLSLGGYQRPHRTKYLVRLPIDLSAVDPAKQHSSRTMIATEILNHYLSPLAKLNLECRDTPMAAVGGGIQYAAKTWIPKEDYQGPITVDQPIWVEAQVFYATDSGTMIVRLTVGGRYTN